MSSEKVTLISLQAKQDSEMTPKELIALGASIAQIEAICDNLKTIKSNLTFCNSYSDNIDKNLIRVFGDIFDIKNEVEQIIKKETK